MAYTPKTWEKDELIEASDLNNIEEGIKNLDTKLNEAVTVENGVLILQTSD